MNERAGRRDVEKYYFSKGILLLITLLIAPFVRLY
jgi:hypothetical protein